ncbi:MAG: pseudouridine synthase [Eubacteriales bacterium]
MNIRLNKYLAECGVCSRREADRLIDTGKVKVNGVVASMGTKVVTTDQVMVHGKIVKSQNTKVVLAYYKPIGVTCTEKDKYAKKTVIEDVKFPVRVTYAGRLDKDSEGLLLMTNDGDLIHSLMRAANHHEKEYIVKVNKEIDDSFLEKMSKGIYIEELKQTTRECSVDKIGKFTFSIILTQGLNRQIRRMCQSCGYEVKSLKRIRIANILLGKLKIGEYRVLTDEEIKELYGQMEK